MKNHLNELSNAVKRSKEAIRKEAESSAKLCNVAKQLADTKLELTKAQQKTSTFLSSLNDKCQELLPYYCIGNDGTITALLLILVLTFSNLDFNLMLFVLIKFEFLKYLKIRANQSRAS